MTASGEQIKNDNFTLRAQKSMEVDAGGRPISGSITKYDDDATNTYVGKAAPGTATSAANWSIKRINNSTGEITWADSVFEYVKVWNNRTGYTYA